MKDFYGVIVGGVFIEPNKCLVLIALKYFIPCRVLILPFIKEIIDPRFLI